MIDPITHSPAQIRLIQPYQATKSYLCPGCNTEIAPRTAHFVVVPFDNVELRRHWHRRCLEWETRHGR
ncbi:MULTISPECIES: hypothetical protein [Ferrimicrobium]|uniref:hypothetical protein n=1 Tax=Ferrimicrobium TaxID=121038 RepID=UPI0026050342|nr:hypothetical protein [Ferrimicrobium sp.]